MPTEGEIAGASYVMNFLDDVENLTNTYATYLNVMVRVKDKYGLGKKEEGEKKKQIRLEPEDEQAILEVNEAMRVWIARCYIKASTLQKKIDKMKDGVKNLKKSYESAISSSTIEKEIAESFVMEINSLFMEGILTELLVRSQDIYRDVLQ